MFGRKQLKRQIGELERRLKGETEARQLLADTLDKTRRLVFALRDKVMPPAKADPQLELKFRSRQVSDAYCIYPGEISCAAVARWLKMRMSEVRALATQMGMPVTSHKKCSYIRKEDAAKIVDRIMEHPEALGMPHTKLPDSISGHR